MVSEEDAWLWLVGFFWHWICHQYNIALVCTFSRRKIAKMNKKLSSKNEISKENNRKLGRVEFVRTVQT